MKKTTLAMVLLVVVVAAKAQVSLGIKAGANNNFASTTNSNVKIDPLSPGFYGGAFVNYRFAPMFALQVELFYSGEGSKFKQKGNAAVYTDKLGYMDLPVLIQLRTKGGFYLETGPQIGFLLSANESASGVSENIKSDVNGTKFSWCFGLGQIIAKKVGIGIRYAVGLSNINSSSVSAGTGNIKDGVLSLGLSYAFQLK